MQISSDHYKKTLRNAMVEISNSLTRIAAERDQIKSICDHVKEEIQVNPKLVRKLGSIYYKQNLTALVGETEEIKDLYEGIMNKPI
jgi:uncharacterized coiled-coil DUF342 family protein